MMGMKPIFASAIQPSRRRSPGLDPGVASVKPVISERSPAKAGAQSRKSRRKASESEDEPDLIAAK